MNTGRGAIQSDWEIIPLDFRQLDNAAKVLAEAFFDYPMFTFYFPNATRRAHQLPWYLRNVLKCALRYGEVWTTPEVAGVLFALPPGHTSLSMREYVRNGFMLTPIVLGLRNYQRSMQCERFVGQAQKELMARQRHYYLWGVAVDPSQQARGIGEALLRPFLARSDAEGMPVYLETHDERNVGYYERHGFELLLETSIPKHTLPIWCMRRTPSSVIADQI
jgi:ribosomal protein S18 acetylase RimI-like enzyme